MIERIAVSEIDRAHDLIVTDPYADQMEQPFGFALISKADNGWLQLAKVKREARGFDRRDAWMRRGEIQGQRVSSSETFLVWRGAINSNLHV